MSQRGGQLGRVLLGDRQTMQSQPWISASLTLPGVTAIFLQRTYLQAYLACRGSWTAGLMKQSGADDRARAPLSLTLLGVPWRHKNTLRQPTE
jgi:hypothetical protein